MHMFYWHICPTNDFPYKQVFRHEITKFPNSTAKFLRLTETNAKLAEWHCKLGIQCGREKCGALVILPIICTVEV